MDQMVGQILDNTYRIEKMLGQGGMGAVFLGRDIALNRDVAIKVMHPHVAAQEGFRERFLQEARAIAALEHPGIVPIYTFSRDPKLLYIVMAFLPGQNLRDWLSHLSQQNMRVSLAESLAIVESVADALAYAHRRGVYHRDVKPGNIILKPLDVGQTNIAGLPFQPVLTDFGLAKLAEGGVHSITGMAMGTPAYMAPEQCEGLEIDGRADIYALGIVLYELVTGRVPFYVKTLTEAIRAHTKEPPPPPRSVAPDLPSQVEEIILKALAKRPQDRYQTADLMAQACRAVRSALPRQEEATFAATQAGQVSLATMLSREAPPPAPERDAWPTPPAEIPVGGRVLVMSPEGRTMAIPFAGKQRLTIGRDPSNDIAIPSPRVSRHHAQITFDGTRYYLTDLNSTNGTFLGNDRLLPGIAEPWQPTQQARVGDHWLRLEVAGAAPAPQPQVSAVGAAPAAAPPAQPITATLEPSRLEVQAGQAVDAIVRILNRQTQVDHFSLAVEGLPEAWVTCPAQPLRLAPGDTGTLSLRIAPPRAPTSTAGAHPFTVRVISQANPSRAETLQGVLTIAPFHEIKAALTPTVLNYPGRGTLRVENLGNIAEQITLSATDPQEALNILPQPAQFALRAGEQTAIALPVSIKGKRPFAGTPQTHSFVINAATPDGHGAAVQGSLNVKPILPAWAIPVLTMLVLLLCAGAAFAYSTIQKNNAAKATATAVAAASQTAKSIARMQALATSTATAVQPFLTATAAAMTEAQMKAATANAATATADWLKADPDQDGLTNEQELQWGTNPQNKDTDGDTLPDGQEVAMGISPTSKDTDGDGLQDNVDPAPGSLPSPTPQPTETPLPTPTPTQTPIPAFAEGSKREFSFSATSIGAITQVCLRHDNSGPSPDWYVKAVKVDSGSGYETFTFERWIATDKGDGSLTACISKATPTPTVGIIGPVITMIPLIPLYATPTPTSSGFIIPKGVLITTPIFRVTLVAPAVVIYKVEVETGTMAGAGTSARVEIRLTSTSGSTDWIPLE